MSQDNKEGWSIKVEKQEREEQVNIALGKRPSRILLNIFNDVWHLWMSGSKIKVEKKEIRRESQHSTWQAPIIVDVLAKENLGQRIQSRGEGIILIPHSR